MHVIILYQHRVRELQACERLARELERRGLRCSVFNIDFELGSAAAAARREGCDAVLVPWMYHSDNYLLMRPFVKVNPSVLLVNLHQEQIGSPVSKRVLLPKGYDAKNSVLHYVWGDSFASDLRRTGVPGRLIAVTGNMRNDIAASGLRSKEQLGQEFGLDPSKRWILIAESRGWVLSYTPSFHRDLLATGYSEREADDFVAVTRRSLQLAVSELDALPGDFLEDCEIIYRPHPGTVSDSFTNPRIHVISRYGIHDWLANIDLIVVWTSTTIYEAEMHGVPGVVWEPVPNPPEFRMAGMERFPVISEFEDLADVLRRPLGRTRYFVDLFGPDDHQSAGRIADALQAALSDPPEGYRARRPRRSLHYARHRAFELLTDVAVRTRLLDRLKFPRSAYAHRMDIPRYGAPE